MGVVAFQVIVQQLKSSLLYTLYFSHWFICAKVRLLDLSSPRPPDLLYRPRLSLRPSYAAKVHPSKHLLVLKTSLWRLQDMFWRRLQHVFGVTILRLPRRLEDILQDVLKTSSRRLEDALKDVKLLRWRRLEDMSWKHLEDILETNKILTGDICILIRG